MLSNSRQFSSLFICFVASRNVSDYLLQVTLTLSGLEYLRTVLKTLSFPVMINNVTEIHSINTTTGMSATCAAVRCVLRTALNQCSFFSVYSDCIWVRVQMSAAVRLAG